MDPDFWHARWRDANTPWHEGRVNAMLAGHFDALSLPERAEVLVPLCGKAADMRWLLARRHRVLGVELSPIAARAFFTENGLRVREREAGAYRVFEGDDVRILCGDVFALAAEHVAGVGAVYDRAALIALDAPRRERYAALLARVLPPGCRQLLVTLEYDGVRMEGPPFSLGAGAVRALYGTGFRVEHLASDDDALDAQPRLRERGLDALTEHAFLLLDTRG